MHVILIAYNIKHSASDYQVGAKVGLKAKPLIASSVIERRLLLVKIHPYHAQMSQQQAKTKSHMQCQYCTTLVIDFNAFVCKQLNVNIVVCYKTLKTISNVLKTISGKLKRHTFGPRSWALVKMNKFFVLATAMLPLSLASEASQERCVSKSRTLMTKSSMS